VFMAGPAVIHVVTSLAFGGLEKFVVSLVNERNVCFKRSTNVCCVDVPGELVSEVVGNVVCLDADRSKFPWDFSAVRKLREVIGDKLSGKQITDNKEQITRVSRSVILHAHNMAAWQYAVLASIGTNAKVVYTQHGVNVHNQGFKNRLRSVFLSWFTDRILAVSANTADAMAKYQDIPRRRIKVVRNGIDVNKSTDTTKLGNDEVDVGSAIGNLKSKIGIPPGSFVIGSVGRLDHVKGYDVLISAFAGLVKDAEKQAQSDDQSVSISLVLLLVGDGPERTKLEVQAVDFGVNKQVVFAGYHGDVGKYLQAMDIFVLPSRSEGISISLLEACASGLPVVVTDAGGNGEVIENEVTGLVVPSDDDSALLSAIERLVADEVLRKKMAEAARERVGEEFAIGKTMLEYEKIYEAYR